MKSKLLCLISILLILTLVPIETLAYVEGGTVGSNLGDGSASTIEPGRKASDLSVGPNSGNCYGLKWAYWDANNNGEEARLTLSSIYYDRNGKEVKRLSVDENAVMAAYVMKDANKKQWKLYSWSIWFKDYGTPASWGPKGKNYYKYGIWNAPDAPDGGFKYSADPNKQYWKINRPLLLEIVERDGWEPRPDEEWYKRGNEILDIVWLKKNDLEEMQPPEPNTETIKSIYKVTSSKDGVIFKDTRSLDKIFNSPIETIDYDFSTEHGEFFHSNEIEAQIVCISREEIYDKKLVDGKLNWVVSDYKYSLSPLSNKSKTINYIAIPPSVSPDTIFVPMNLNRNGKAIESDYKRQYGTSNGKSLKVSVDNMQNINNNDNIKMLDTNTITQIKIRVENDQLGIPTKAEGGWDLLTKQPDYSTAMKYGKTRQITGKLTTDNLTKNLNGDVSDDFRYNGKLNGKITGGETLTISEGNNREILAKDFNLNKTNGWKGDKFSIRNIKTGIYKFKSDFSDNWWEITYLKGKYWTYGARYRGKVTIEGVQNPTTITSLSHKDIVKSKQVQPFIKGSFESKTVGGGF